MRLFAVLSLALATLSQPSIVSAAEDVVIVYDGSGSMWGQIDGVAKVEIAREVIGDLIATWPEDANVGLMAYGHRREGDCSDIETLIAPGPLDRSAFVSTVNGVTPRGRTPLTESVRQAAELLSYRDTQATVILISDGLETCQADPCALSAELAQQGVNFTAHVVGFDLTEEEHAGLACIAENTGGVFVPAQDADDLRDALALVQSAVHLEPLLPSQPEPEPEHQVDADIELEAPATVVTGASFAVSWSSAIDPQDYVTIVPIGADENSRGDYQRVRGDTEGSLTAPAEPGLYEVRYVLNDGRRVLGTAPMEIVEAEVTISAPDEVTTGANFIVSWSSSIHPQDYVTIVPAGADEGSYTNYQRVRETTENRLVAPAEPGLYEVRYVLNEGSRTLASIPVEVVEAEMSVSAPETVTTGASFAVSWSSSVHPQDYVTIVPAGADEGSYTNYQRVRETTENSLVAPADPGLYEVRYVLNEGSRTLASIPVEVVEAEISISAPKAVTTGARFSVSWSSSNHPQDYVTIVPAGADEGSYTNYQRVREDTENSLTAPAEPGVYEVRYVLNEGSRTLVSRPVEVVAAEVVLNGPDVARAQTPLRISWSMAIHPQDYITIVPAGADEGTYRDYMRVRDNLEGDLDAPAEPGLYEIRYVLQEGDRTVSSRMLEVVGADAPLDDGVGLVVPSQASPGEIITVSWSGGAGSADQRLALARADQADFSWIEAHRIAEETTLELTMPNEPGRYEVRYLDISGQVVLGRAIVEVE
ncbi:Ca-activated chloride channel family protein [Paracoccus alcaliphilus]|uniref:Ca-activated chloride channel family protein n=1 Tax=Paracoccus alcaliphilus TaxID=34002 RepID=A0A1H8NDE2_9RHOB|nr:VWA domain-containing protein [Paracoccus alcaliphilus]WCR18617.1 VWA domain-containing protein [Paracoccus alcaliphilus]SEO27634.1 Ca-activated chloride channel family protein [Paracoccus alcaliphilus]